jgi:hypothetical protein
MILLWLGLAAFSGFIAWRSLSEGSYLRGSFAAFWCVLFVFSIWVDFHNHTAALT